MIAMPATVGSVLVVAGGESPEREISFASGQAVHDTLKASGIVSQLVTLDDLNALMKHFTNLTRGDIVFNALHGGLGEGGGLPALLDTLSLRYTHSGSRASMIAMNKPLFKVIMRQHGIPVPAEIVLPLATIAHRHAHKELPFDPCILKPLDGGSSIDTHPVFAKDPFPIPTISDRLFMVEPLLTGREATVGVLDGRALAVTEIVKNDAVYDTNSKYDPSGAAHRCPADFSAAILGQLSQAAERIVALLGVRGVSRLDAIVLPDDTIQILELNTHPGLTSASLVPEQAQIQGLSFPDLLFRLLASARYDL